MLTFAPHPLLFPAAFLTEFQAVTDHAPAAITDLHQPGALVDPQLHGMSPLDDDDREDLRQAVRNVLREGGHKPTGRGKPSSEYLVRAQSEQKIPSINVPVDVCNAVSLHSGIPMSVIDVDRAKAPFGVRVAGEESYIFNASGQEISLRGLLCLCDATGPIANAVKDCHRTKTSPSTTRTLSILWGPVSHEDHVIRTMGAYRKLLEQHGQAKTTPLT